MQAATSPASDYTVRHKVLIVEDEVVVRTIVAEFLRDADVDVYEAANADEAVVLLDLGVDIDLILTDVRMPGSMNGLELARYVRARRPNVRIALTSADLREWPSKSLADAFFPKPTNLPVLVERVVRLLNEPND